MEYWSGYLYPHDGHCLSWLCSSMGSILPPLEISLYAGLFLPAG